MDQSKLRMLVAVSHAWLRDTLAQLLRRAPIEALPVDNLEALFAQARTLPDAILIDPFAFGRPSLRLLDAIRREAPRVPIVALLPADTADYRDAATRLGANGIVILDRAATDLLPTVTRLVARSDLVTGVAERITQLAQRATPAGNAAYDRDPLTSNLQTLSERAVERLAPSSPDPILPSSSRSGENVFVRGLSVAAGSPAQSAPERKVRTACNLNCGAHFCGLDVTVRGDHIVKVEPAGFPNEDYRRICLKGISHVQAAAHPDRLLHPLKRSGPRGSDRWQHITWDQALDEIAGRMQALMHRYSPASVMFFPFSGQLSALNGFAGVYLRLASALGASATSQREWGIDSAVPSGIEDTLGAGAGYLANDYTDLPSSRLVLIWGGDPANSRVNWWRCFLDAQRSGARLIDIDPRFSVTAGKCDEWLPIRPGTDLYLALAMLRLIIERNWIDADFVIRHTVAPLLVREDDGRFLKTARGYLAWDESIQKAVLAEEAQSPALTGRFVVKGVACQPAFDLLKQVVAPYTPEYAAQKIGLSAEQIVALTEAYATTKPARIFTIYGIDRWHHGATFGRLIATLAALTGNLGVPGGGAGVDGFCEGALFNSDFAAPEGRAFRGINPATLPNQIVTGQPYPIKGVFVAFSNWLSQWPNQNYLRESVLPQLDLLVVADQSMTETALWADYVLPAAHLFEREDMVKGPGPYVQYQPQIVPPPGECRSDFSIAAALADRLDMGQFFSCAPTDYMRDILASLPDDQPALSFDELRAKGVLRRNVPTEPPVAFRDRVFQTSTGRVEFYVERLLPFGRALPDYEQPAEAQLEGAQAQRYPLVLITEHSRYRVHSTFVNVPWLREIDVEPRATIHPSVAAARCIVDGDWVRVFNDRGFVVLRGQISQSVSPEMIVMSQGWRSSDFAKGHIQSLTHGIGNTLNAFGPNSSFFDVLVEVTREGAGT